MELILDPKTPTQVSINEFNIKWKCLEPSSEETKKTLKRMRKMFMN